MIEAPRHPPPSSAHSSLVVLMPVYNDWEAVSLLLTHLDRVLIDANIHPHVLLVDDGSQAHMGGAIAGCDYTSISKVQLLTLRRNLGHQRAIAIGLAFAQDRLHPSAVLVMDGDGEDAPEDVPRLVSRLNEERHQKVIFAERRRRSESLSFRFFYFLYRISHVLLTGIPVRVGNFSIIPETQLARLVVVSELWNHYAASVFMAKLPRGTIPTIRARRLSGRSKLNFMSLVGHGLSALSVHAELIGIRLLVMVGALLTLVGLFFVSAIGLSMMRAIVIPSWLLIAGGVLTFLLLQATAFSAVFVFVVLHARSQPLFIPLRDYPNFVDRVTTLVSCD